MRIDLPAGPVHVDEAFDDPDADLEPGTSGIWPEAALRGGGTTALDRIPEAAVERVCYLPDRPAGWAAVRDPGTGRGVALAWDVEAFPHLWLWEQIGGWRFPFYGRARLVGIEPVSCWPGDGLARAIERGQARTIGPHGSASAWVTLALFDATMAAVDGVDRAGRVSSAGDTTRMEAMNHQAPVASVFASGLDHPEGLAVAPDGTIWAGGEEGQIYIVTADGKVTEHARTGGFSGGLAFDRDGSCFVCNSPGRIVRVEQDGRWGTFAEAVDGVPLRVPNFPVFGPDGSLFVSDSGSWEVADGVIYRFRPGRLRRAVPCGAVPLHERSRDRRRRRIPLRRRDRAPLGRPPPHRRGPRRRSRSRSAGPAPSSGCPTGWPSMPPAPCT